jgi:hypothetical protein
MTQEDKELLLKDLCARLPYGVKVQHQHQNYLNEVQTIEHISRQYGEIETESVLGFVDDFKPYLRPMSSMTKDEKEELVDFGLAYWDSGKYIDEDGNAIIYCGKEFQLLPDIETYDWLNKNHFDYRGLIPMGLAIDATGLNIY